MNRSLGKLISRGRYSTARRLIARQYCSDGGKKLSDYYDIVISGGGMVGLAAARALGE